MSERTGPRSWPRPLVLFSPKVFAQVCAVRCDGVAGEGQDTPETGTAGVRADKERCSVKGSLTRWTNERVKRVGRRPVIVTRQTQDEFVR